jgi:release factor glutamine methyltransferase
LVSAGCVAASDEADELLACAGDDAAHLEEMVARRVLGEPLAWIVGSVVFCGLRLRVDSGVYVPRWQSEPLAERAASLLSEGALAIDLCSGAGPIAAVIGSRVPRCRVLGTEIDPVAAACARANGVEIYIGDLFEPLPHAFAERVDLVTGVVPYVPHEALGFLPRDVLAYEPLQALDGAEGGTRYLTAVAEQSPRWLRPRGWLLLELGGEQADELGDLLAYRGFTDIAIGTDEDGDVRSIEARWNAS